MGNKIHGINLADIHFGAMCSKTLYEELDNCVFSYITENEKLDFIVITGDYFHKKLSMNSVHGKYSLYFMSNLINICVERKIKLRIIKGTESHDNDQLSLLISLNRDNKCDMRIIYSIESEELFEGFKVLYIPEEYVENKDDHYKESFDRDDYDMIFGHGLINESLIAAHHQESAITMKKAPIFSVKQLLNISKGPVIFGHIHKHMIIRDRFIYSGSFSRTCFGEEENKGFISFSYDKSTYAYEFKFINNNNARLFDTIEIDFNEAPDNYENSINYIYSNAKSLLKDRLRIIINIDEKCENPLLVTKLLNGLFVNEKDIKLIINNDIKTRQKKEMEKKMNTLITKYGFIFDKSISPEEKIERYIKIKHDKHISLDRIKSYLYDEIQ